MMIFRFCLCAVVLCGAMALFGTGSWAQNAVRALGSGGLSTDSQEPIEITADGALEWHRNDLRFVAKTVAKAQQGASSVAADLLTADYRDGASSSMEVYHLTAEGHVVLVSGENTAYGQHADYDLDKGVAVLSGEGLRMVSPDQTITAQERFEYFVDEGRVNALGRAKVVRPKVQGGADTLEADKISALFKENSQGQRALHMLEAFGNVVIVTPSEEITGAYGVYYAATNKAELKGGVKILRGPNVLEGERAVVDLTSNVSRIFGTGSGGDVRSDGGRVRGVFYPNSAKKK